jgi:uncharacterized protein
MRLMLTALLLAGVVGCDSEPVSEFEATRKAAEQGDALAQNNLGLMYAHGKGVPENDVEALKWYRKAAEQGNAQAQHFLGGMYFAREGGPEDDAEAVKWFRKAAEQGYAPAQFLLGCMYRVGRGVPKDNAEAYVWFSVSVASEQQEYEPDVMRDDYQRHRREAKAELTPEQVAAAQQRATELFEQINANKAK